MADDLIALWTNMSAGHLYKSWKGGLIAGLMWHKGLYDTSPMKYFLTEYFGNKTIHRLLHFNSVDTKTGNIVSFTE